MNEKSVFGKRVKYLRESENIKREEFADKLRITYSALSKYETGERFPSPDIINKIADFFNVTTDYLLGRTDNPKITILENGKIPEELKNIDIEMIALLNGEKGLTKEELEKLLKIRDMFK